MVRFDALIDSLAEFLDSSNRLGLLVQAPAVQKYATLERRQLIGHFKNVIRRKDTAKFMHDRAHLWSGLMRGSYVHSLCKIATPFDVQIARALDVIRMCHAFLL